MPLNALDYKNESYAIDSEDGTYLKIVNGKLLYNDMESIGEYDNYGYLKVNVNSEVFNLIDGKHEYLLFNKRSLFKELKKTPDNSSFFIPDASLNGKNLLNITSSSVLTDKYHSYSPEGIGKAWAKSDIWWCWVKNNIPWVEGKLDDGIDEYIEFDVKKKGNNNQVLIILNGYVNPEKKNLFRENNRIKSALLICDNKDSFTINFNDVVEFTEIELPKEYEHFKLIIKEVFKGTKYSDTCITGIEIK